MIYIGIDNGISGGLVALSDHPGLAPVAMLPMPVQAKAKGQEVDVVAVWSWLEPLASQATVVVEKPGGAKSAKAAVSMADSFAVLRAIVELKQLRHVFITPQKWQKEMLPNCTAGDTKAFALSVVRRLWPSETWLASSRCKTPHTGLVDAALIAEFGRRKGL